MELAEDALVQASELNRRPFEAFYLLISTQDGLISWLCEHDDCVDPSFTNEGGSDVYLGKKKKKVVENSYEEYNVFSVVNSGTEFRRKWADFWYHRHRIMHGHPEAFFDENLAITSLLFLTSIANLVLQRMDDLEGYDRPYHP
ncbi:hypothetical protein [Saliphagus sp. LR7]|uniref:hypothetical protein n=1 Tax=Saliphagus sp. LR7 TaxID=2282654 RepID=UPI00130057FF|nr:hypothetical protein [Saliphagus sp. LR7]